MMLPLESTEQFVARTTHCVGDVYLQTCLYVFEYYACIHVYALCAWRAHRGQNRVSDTLKLNLYTIVSNHMGPGNSTRIPWKIS